MGTWREGIIAALDLETTGIDPLRARIVQAALVLVGPDGTIGEESWTGMSTPASTSRPAPVRSMASPRRSHVRVTSLPPTRSVNSQAC